MDITKNLKSSSLEELFKFYSPKIKAEQVNGRCRFYLLSGKTHFLLRFDSVCSKLSKA